MNTPENLSPAATRLYNILSSGSGPQTKEQLEYAYSQNAMEEPKAIATANSLIVKGIISAEKGEGETTYTLIKPAKEVGPNDEADANEEYVEKTDANAEEKRMIDLLEQNDQKLPEAKLFGLYAQEQTPATESNNPADIEAIEKALQELTEAGAVKQEGAAYSIQQ